MINTLILKSQDAQSIDRCADIIKSGGLVAFPTETVYGLGANGLDAQAVKNIFEAKGRPSDNPLILHISELDAMYSLYESVPERALRLAERFWPGPLTIIYKRSDVVPDEVTAGLDTVALRMPKNECALSLIRSSGLPIAAPSANRSGKPSPTRAAHVINDLNGRIDAILDGGDCIYGLESTVVTLADNVPMILRPGAVTQKELMDCLNEKVLLSESLLAPLKAGETVKSPGMKYKHYSPNAEVYAVYGTNDEIAQKIIREYDDNVSQNKRCMILGSIENSSRYGNREKLILGSRKYPLEFCEKLFAALRLCDDYDMAFCETLPEDGLGLAYMNRLLRAAGFKKI